MKKRYLPLIEGSRVISILKEDILASTLALLGAELVLSFGLVSLPGRQIITGGFLFRYASATSL